MDRSISAAVILTAVLWFAGAVFTGLSVAFPNRGYGPVGIYVTSIAAVLQVHGFIRCMMRHQQSAFELGVEAGRVSRLRH